MISPVFGAHHFEPSTIELAALMWLDYAGDPLITTKLLHENTSPSHGLAVFLEDSLITPTMTTTWIGRALQAKASGVTALTCKETSFPAAWAGIEASSWAPAVLWQKNAPSIPQSTPIIAVTGSLDGSGPSRCRGGAAGAWLAGQRCVTTALTADPAGVAALLAARTVSKGRLALPTCAQGLLSHHSVDPGLRMIAWGNAPMESIATPTTENLHPTTIRHALRMLVTRADIVIVTSANTDLQLADIIRTTSTPTIVIGPPTHWAADLVAEGLATRAADVTDLRGAMPTPRRTLNDRAAVA